MSTQLKDWTWHQQSARIDYAMHITILMTILCKCTCCSHKLLFRWLNLIRYPLWCFQLILVNNNTLIGVAVSQFWAFWDHFCPCYVGRGGGGGLKKVVKNWSRFLPSTTTHVHAQTTVPLCSIGSIGHFPCGLGLSERSARMARRYLSTKQWSADHEVGLCFQWRELNILSVWKSLELANMPSSPPTLCDARFVIKP